MYHFPGTCWVLFMSAFFLQNFPIRDSRQSQRHGLSRSTKTHNRKAFTAALAHRKFLDLECKYIEKQTFERKGTLVTTMLGRLSAFYSPLLVSFRSFPPGSAANSAI